MIICGDILKLEGYNVVVNPANAYGIMGAGLAGAIHKSIGTIAYQQNLERFRGTNVDVGDIYVFGNTGNLSNYKRIWNVVTMKSPGGYTDLTIIEKCLNNIIVRMGLWSGPLKIAVPGLGIGIGRLNKQEVAKLMVERLSMYFEDGFHSISICDRNGEFIRYCEEEYANIKTSM